MEQKRRRASGAWLLAVPVLTGAAGGVAPWAGAAVVVVAALTTAAVLWRAGRRASRGLRGWTLLSLAIAAGVGGSAVGKVVGPAADSSSIDTVRTMLPLPAMVLAIAAVLSLLTLSQLRQGGARLLTETALFFSAAMVIGQVLMVGPALTGSAVDAPARLALELSCLAMAALLSAVLVLVSASTGPRRATGVLLLLAAGSQAAAHGLAVVGESRQLAVLAAVPAAQLASLLLVCLAVRRDTRSGARRLPTGDEGPFTFAGQLLPHLVMVVAAVLHVASAVLDGSPQRTAGGALLAGLLLTAVHRWVTARDESRVEARLRRSEAYFRSLVQSSSDAVLILDSALTITWAAPSLEAPADPARPSLAGRSLPDVVHPDDLDAVLGWLAHDSASSSALTGLRSFRLPGRLGCWRVLEAGVTDLRADDDVRALVLHCRDVTARLDREDELHSLAFTDPLTGLPNRAAQLQALGRRLAVLGGGSADVGATDACATPDDTVPAAEDVPDEGAALLLFDLQGLQGAREHAGRDVVEVVLLEVARRLRATVRGEDHVARFGPESFSVLASGTGVEPDRLAARCLAVIEQPISTDLGIVDLTAAVGLVPLVPGLTEPETLEQAELAVSDARRAGPGSVRRYRDSLGEARARRERLRRDLVGARERGELDLAWQPIVALADHRVTGVEALLRWRHPVYGDVPPVEFLPVAERAGLIVDLQRWVLREATTAAVELPDHGVELKLGINISAHHLAAGTLVGDVSTALAASGLPPERLVVEIAESAVAVEGEHVAADVAALRLMGVRLALDDFGSGHSSLSGLARLPVDIIKLDRTFLARVDRNPYTRALCESVVGIGAALKVDVVAEGVETTSQLAALEAIGCGFAQGFLLCRPVSFVSLVELLDEGAGLLWSGIPSRV